MTSEVSGGGDMDILPQLPEEVQILILKYVSVKDLGRCFSVSKKWFDLVNIDIIWMRQCLIFGILPEEEKDFVIDINSVLCKWAQIWRSFRKSPSYGWRTCSSKTIEMGDSDFTKLKMSDFAMLIGPRNIRTKINTWIPMWTRGSTLPYGAPAWYWNSIEFERGSFITWANDGKFIVYYNKLSLSLVDVSEIDKTKCTITLPFPSCKSETPPIIAVNNEYLAVSKCNILVIYKLLENEYQCFFALSMDDEVITEASTDITSFVNNRFIEAFQSICIFPFNKDGLWIMDQKGLKTYVVNLIEMQISEIEHLDNCLFTQTHVISWSHGRVKVDDLLGKNVLNMRKNIIMARANNNLLVTLGCDLPVSFSGILEIFDIKTGNLISCKPYPMVSFDIHPTLNIIYQFHGYSKKCITASLANTGEECWNVKVLDTLDKGVWYLRIVCNRFIILFDTMFSDTSQQSKIYVFNLKNGQFLYQTERPPGHLMHISDNLLITKFKGGKMYLRNYLNFKEGSSFSSI